MEKNTELLNKALHLLPEVRKTKIVPPKGQSFFEPLGKDGMVEIDFGRHMVGYLHLKLGYINSHPDAPVWLKIYFAESKKELEEKLAEDGIIVKKMQSLGAGKHIFSHIEWHMKGYLIELSPTGKQPELIFASLEEVEDTYSLPTAFRTYREKMRKILNKQKEGGVSEKKGVL